MWATSSRSKSTTIQVREVMEHALFLFVYSLQTFWARIIYIPYRTHLDLQNVIAPVSSNDYEPVPYVQ